MDTGRLKQMVEEGLGRIPSQERNVGDEERWLSLSGGVALALAAMRRGGLGGILLGAIGGMLLYRGASGHCAVYQRMGYNTAGSQLLPRRELRATTSIIIDRPRDELYSAWRNFDNLPRFMQHILEVTTYDDRRSHWVARMPLGQRVEWDSEVTEDVPNERIKWQSTGDSAVQHHGEVRFRPATDGRGTEVDVDLHYLPPGGSVGTAFARLISGLTRYEIQADVRRFKQLMETGEISTAQQTQESQEQS
jgi:uncharacterized membrane protein